MLMLKNGNGGGLPSEQKGSLHNNGFAYATPNPKMQLLWTNPAPAAAFGAQTLKLDLTKYDLINILTTTNDLSNYYQSHILVKMPDKYQTVVDFKGSQKMHRNIKISDTGIEFTVNTKYTAYQAETVGTVDNTLNRPIYIYGIKL